MYLTISSTGFLRR